jgi:hypothetical protein
MKRHAIIEDSDSAYAKAKLSTHSADGLGRLSRGIRVGAASPCKCEMWGGEGVAVASF